ncbi:tetratricopeptide repeat protein [Candidatus Dependentiae bacterium]|nr:tetratricopeptide repeat protein [Candidatus Dependentiae bacterium]
MNIKSLKFYIFVFLLFFLYGCGKRKTNKLAQNYYKMAVLELQDQKTSKEYSYKKALDYIDKSLEIEEKSEYIALKGTILFELGYESFGENLFDQALEKTDDPKLKCEILNNKACLMAQVGMYKDQGLKIGLALDIWKKLENDKDYLTPEVSLFNQSKVFVFNNDYNNAKKKLEKAVQISPNYLDAHYYLALVNYNLSDYVSAKNELDTVLFLYPDHKGAQNLKRIMQKI